MRDHSSCSFHSAKIHFLVLYVSRSVMFYNVLSTTSQRNMPEQVQYLSIDLRAVCDKILGPAMSWARSGHQDCAFKAQNLSRWLRQFLDFFSVRLSQLSYI